MRRLTVLQVNPRGDKGGEQKPEIIRSLRRTERLKVAAKPGCLSALLKSLLSGILIGNKILIIFHCSPNQKQHSYNLSCPVWEELC